MGGTKRPPVIRARANKMFFRKPIMYALEASKYDTAELNDGASENDVNVGAIETDVNGETNEEGVNSGTTEGGEVLEGDINGRGLVRLICIEANEVDVDGKSFMSDSEGHYTSEDGGSCNEREFEGYANFCRDDYMDYGVAQEAASSQGAAQEAASNQDTGVKFEGASIVGSSGDEFERACDAGSAGAKQARACTEDEHIEPDSVDPHLGDPQCW
ncbi:hypothetical protein ACH5RR_018433 [Cinchona calisaya]|uniref:Uncharacterized protein n=1 Tax=Cinchona calisaya TaxID=153742 RepID=A0ABD2ZLZ5_9GENT